MEVVQESAETIADEQVELVAEQQIDTHETTDGQCISNAAKDIPPRNSTTYTGRSSFWGK